MAELDRWSLTATLDGGLSPVKHFFNYFNLFCCGWSPTYYSSAMPNKRDPNKIRVQTWVSKEDKPPLMIDKSNDSTEARP